VCVHHTRRCRLRRQKSTTAKRPGKRVEPGQALGRQPSV
jgi:hypothetical protein